MVFFDNRQEIPLPADIESRLQTAIETTLQAEGVTEPCEVSLSFVTEEEIRALNASYRDRDRVTDVLSFPVDFALDLPVRPLGDIVLCPARAEKQAEEIGHSPAEELVYLTIHSVLHLLGYDHMDADEKAVMRSREKSVLSEVEHGTKETNEGF